MDAARLLDSVAATARDCIIVVDLDDRIVWVSSAALDTLGWAPDELLGRHLSLVIAPTALDLQDRASRLLSKEKSGPVVCPATRSDGSPTRALVWLGAVTDAKGTLTGVTLVLRDLSELIGERDLARGPQVLREQLVHAPLEPQAVLDLRGEISSVNAAWAELLGHPVDFFEGRPLTDLMHTMDPQRADDLWTSGRLREVERTSIESLFVDARGQTLRLLLDLTVLRDDDAAPIAVAVSARDLTRVKDAEERLAEHEDLYRALSRHAADAAVVTDDEMNVVYVNPVVSDMLGYDATDMLARNGGEFIHPADMEIAQRAVRRVLAEPRSTERFVVRVRTQSDQWRWFEIAVINGLDDRAIGGMVANLRDVTDQVETQRALSLSEALHRAMVETAQEGISATAPNGTTMFANEKMAEILGLSLGAVYRLDTLALLEPAPADVHDDDRGPSAGPLKYELQYRHPDGDVRVLAVSRSPLPHEGAESLGFLSMVSDVTEARSSERALRRQALHDPLTGLPNRYLFLDRLDRAAARQRRADRRSVGVLFLDLDGFKSINDTHGHEIGDELLIQVGARLFGAVRATDTVGRFGGDEFAVISEDTDEDSAMLVAGRIQAALAAPFVVAGGLELSVGASIGIALSPPHLVDDLLRLADGAMYDAKRGGGQRVHIYSAGLGSS